MLACDAGQSSWMAHGGRFDRPIPDTFDSNGKQYDFVEANPLLGARPSGARTDAYLGVIGVGLVALDASKAPEWVKTAVVVTVATAETFAVTLNGASFQGANAGTCGSREF